MWGCCSMAFLDWWGGKTFGLALPMVPVLWWDAVMKERVDPYCWARAPWLIY